MEIDLTLSSGVEDLQVCLSNTTPGKTAEFHDVIINKL